MVTVVTAAVAAVAASYEQLTHLVPGRAVDLWPTISSIGEIFEKATVSRTHRLSQACYSADDVADSAVTGSARATTACCTVGCRCLICRQPVVEQQLLPVSVGIIHSDDQVPDARVSVHQRLHGWHREVQRSISFKHDTHSSWCSGVCSWGGQPGHGWLGAAAYGTCF